MPHLHNRKQRLGVGHGAACNQGPDVVESLGGKGRWKTIDNEPRGEQANVLVHGVAQLEGFMEHETFRERDHDNRGACGSEEFLADAVGEVVKGAGGSEGAQLGGDAKPSDTVACGGHVDDDTRLRIIRGDEAYAFKHSEFANRGGGAQEAFEGEVAEHGLREQSRAEQRNGTTRNRILRSDHDVLDASVVVTTKQAATRFAIAELDNDSALGGLRCGGCKSNGDGGLSDPSFAGDQHNLRKRRMPVVHAKVPEACARRHPRGAAESRSKRVWSERDRVAGLRGIVGKRCRPTGGGRQGNMRCEPMRSGGTSSFRTITGSIL